MNIALPVSKVGAIPTPVRILVPRITVHDAPLTSRYARVLVRALYSPFLNPIKFVVVVNNRHAEVHS